VALVPLGFVWRNYLEEAKRKDEQLFDATSGLVRERIQLLTVRHLNFFNIMRNQLRSRNAATLESLHLPTDLRKMVPHLTAFGYAVPDGDRVSLQWTNLGDQFPEKSGSNLAADTQLGDAIKRASRNQAPVAALDIKTDRLFVVAVVGSPQQTSGFVVGWLDIASLCSNASETMLREGTLVAIPLKSGVALPIGAKVVSIAEGDARFDVAISRGANFTATYGQVAPKWVLVTGIGCALLLAVLVFQATRTFQLRSALDAERMRGQLVQSFSHEFRTPLSVILSSADLLEAGGDRMDPIRKGGVISQIQESTRQLSEMAEEILLLSRLEAPRIRLKPVQVELRTFCEALARVSVAANKNPVSMDISADGKVLLDPMLLRPALANLVSNAVKYSQSGGVVKIAAEHRSGVLTFTVSDNGIGIPADDMTRLGEAFYRASNVGETPGTGLGLAIVRRTAKLMGGKLDLESNIGQGTVATLTIPVT
jgi:signal transduction histidine kinase